MCQASFEANKKMQVHLTESHAAPEDLRLQNMDALPEGLSLPSEQNSPLASTFQGSSEPFSSAFAGSPLGSNFITTSNTTPEPALQFPSSPDEPNRSFKPLWDASPSPADSPRLRLDSGDAPIRHRVKTVAKAQEDLLLKIDELRTELQEMRCQLRNL
jgi:hypothetical protein